MKALSKVLLVAAALAVSACALNPFATARTLEQKSYALYGSFVIFEEQGAKMMLSTEVPNSVKFRLQQADSAAKPAVDALKDAADSVIAAKRQLAEGATDKEKVSIAVANLSQWYYDAKPKVECLIRTVEGKSCSN